ncbi:MAG: hypothetical protein QM532_04475 [Cyanobium sp. MAG06]|nr:hypothetical protein [Cyanobium sp. MAG06]
MAIDNDHNMDYKYNLVGDDDNKYDEMNYMGNSLQEIFSEIAISATSEVADINEDYLFSISQMDKITEKYSIPVSEKLRLMVSGPHSADIMYGNSCSHSLTTPLKVYLPLLKLNKNEYVVVDEKAGTDGVGTGVTTGFNLAVVVAEATVHGIKSAKQIIDMLNFYKTAFIVVINKIKDNQNIDELCEYFSEYNINKDNILKFHFDINTTELNLSENDRVEFSKLLDKVGELEDDRLQRTKEKIKRQEEYNRE